MGKPRMTQSDKWRKRKVTDSYWSYKDDLGNLALANHFSPCGSMRLIFYIPMPISWGKKKRSAMEYEPHQQKPDIDNLEKGFLDAFLEDDSVVWHLNTYKYWTDDPIGSIEVEHLS